MPYTRAGAALPAVFNTRDEDLHKRLKSPIASIFSLTNVMTLELFVDEVLLVLFEQLERRFVRSSSTCDLGDWLQYFAFEVMASMTFSRRYGFLEFGSDRNGLIEAIWRFMKVAAPVGQCVRRISRPSTDATIDHTDSVVRLCLEQESHRCEAETNDWHANHQDCS